MVANRGGSAKPEVSEMKKSIAIATALVVGASATVAGAITLPAKYYGSDTLFVVTQQAIGGTPGLGASLEGNYLAGGSGAGQGAMGAASLSAALQQTAPMSKMITNGICGNLGGTNGSAATNASGIVIGMDGVDVLASVGSGASTTCNGTADGAGTGLAFSGTTGVFASTTGVQNWKWVLALLYGGLDLSQPSVNPDCNSAARKTLVNNWSKLFQNGCSNGTSVCSDSAHTIGGSSVLWHAFRRDDASGTSDVFSSLLNLTSLMPSTSASSNNGFGASPYCNALNWDTNVQNNGGGFCNNGIHDQFVGPGGIPDPQSACTFTNFKSSSLAVAESCGAAGAGNHRKPPTGAYGDSPISTTTTAYDVLPTSFQDNDPIRRPCLGTTTGAAFNSGEEVCNVDGQLGIVLAIPSSDFIPQLTVPAGQVQYPTNACNTFEIAKAPRIFNCAPFATGVHNGECPNGDVLVAAGCVVPVDTVHGSSQCLNAKSKFTVLTNRPLGSYDGRRHNLHMYDGDLNNGTIAYVQDAIQNGKPTPPTVDFAGGMGRIHTIQTIWDTTQANPPNAGCQMSDATDQVACLVQADPCSVGYAGDGGKSWAARPDGVNSAVCANLAALGVCTKSGSGFTGSTCPVACLSQGSGSPTLVSDAVRVDQTYPTATTVTSLGKQANEYQIARKLYFNSLAGFDAIANTTADPGATGELALGQWESVAANINPILAGVGYFSLAGQTSATFNAPFCEDFNEQVVCNPTSGSPSTLPANVNACTGNSNVALPSVGSTCGNGVVEAYEECDDGLNNGTSGDTCSQTCRCAGVTSFENTGTGWHCQ
jgi:cysteine-rich repeat protein